MQQDIELKAKGRKPVCTVTLYHSTKPKGAPGNPQRILENMLFQYLKRKLTETELESNRS